MRKRQRLLEFVGDLTLRTVFFTALILLGVVFGAWLSFKNPYLDDQVRGIFEEEPVFGGEKIVFTESQRQKITEVYTDVSDEYGWCLEIRENRVNALDHFASLNYTTEENISFSCKERHNGIMHTHPSSYAVAELSEQDRDSLLNSSWIQVSCVVSDPVQEITDYNPRGLACFSEVSGDVERLQVVIGEG